MTERKRAQAGFTMIEVMVAVLLTAIAVIGTVALYRVQTRSSGFSRFSTEASVLASDKMEELRTKTPPLSSATPELGVDARGKVGVGGPYQRSWTVTPDGANYKLRVEVGWDDDGTPRNVTLYSLRGP